MWSAQVKIYGGGVVGGGNGIGLLAIRVPVSYVVCMEAHARMQKRVHVNRDSRCMLQVE